MRLPVHVTRVHNFLGSFDMSVVGSLGWHNSIFPKNNRKIGRFAPLEHGLVESELLKSKDEALPQDSFGMVWMFLEDGFVDFCCWSFPKTCFGVALLSKFHT